MCPRLDPKLFRSLIIIKIWHARMSSLLDIEPGIQVNLKKFAILCTKWTGELSTTSIPIWSPTPNWLLTHYTDCSIKNYEPAFEYRLQKNPLWNQNNETGLWNCDYFPIIQWRPHLIWPNNHKEIWILCKARHGDNSSKFCHLNVHECMWLPQADCVHKRQALKHIRISCISLWQRLFLTTLRPFSDM